MKQDCTQLYENLTRGYAAPTAVYASTRGVEDVGELISLRAHIHSKLQEHVANKPGDDTFSNLQFGKIHAADISSWCHKFNDLADALLIIDLRIADKLGGGKGTSDLAGMLPLTHRFDLDHMRFEVSSIVFHLADAVAKNLPTGP